MFLNHRQGSPKQGSVCPDPSLIRSPINSNGPLRHMVSNGSVKSEHDMPFDLSQTSKHKVPSDSMTDYQSKMRDAPKSEEPLDLRLPYRAYSLNLRYKERKVLYATISQQIAYGLPKTSSYPHVLESMYRFSTRETLLSAYFHQKGWFPAFPPRYPFLGPLFSSISSNLQRHVRNIHNKRSLSSVHSVIGVFGQQTNLVATKEAWLMVNYIG
ncbi:MDS1 and EVI1 complex locus protein [Caerostris extrusa]|uniref:MDS1 and EVI1 complex locus protein n=1 Tax=Caerostris extrusa TaxID=172846 RepID=A0AAV4TWL8_CAEEX|nr:MDS1 and EVI1 complex locus protein [Caerostris extrusa]